MLIRIQGKVTDIKIVGGTSKSTGRLWSKKIYTISDDFKNPEYNRSVQVNDFGKLDPDSYQGEFIYKSNHLVGEVVDLACYIETNEYGFTNVDYGREFADADANKPKDTGNVVYAEQKEEQQEEQQETAIPNSGLPF